MENQEKKLVYVWHAFVGHLFHIIFFIIHRKLRYNLIRELPH